MRSLRTLTAAATLLAALLATAAAPAQARTKRLLPTSFVSLDGNFDTTISPIAVGCITTGATFTTELKLPVGATLNAIRMYSNGVATPRAVTIAKGRYGEIFVAMAGVQETAAVADTTTPLMTAGIVYPYPSNLIEAGHFHYVVINCTPLTAVWGVDIDYTP